jgi:hypothetical protein
MPRTLVQQSLLIGLRGDLTGIYRHLLAEGYPRLIAYGIVHSRLDRLAAECLFFTEGIISPALGRVVIILVAHTALYHKIIALTRNFVKKHNPSRTTALRARAVSSTSGKNANQRTVEATFNLGHNGRRRNN